MLYCPFYFEMIRHDHHIHMPGSITDSEGSTMNHIMTNTPWHILASFLIACFEKRNKHLEINY